MTNKDLISQYVDTGTQIPKYQLNKLSSNDKKTYIRKRVIFCINTQSSLLTDYEYSLITDENEKQRYDVFYEPIEQNYMSQHPSEIEDTYCLFSDSFKDKYNNKWWRDELTDEQYACMNDEMRYHLLYREFNWYGYIYNSNYKKNEFIRLHDKFVIEDLNFESLNDDSNFIKLKNKLKK